MESDCARKMLEQSRMGHQGIGSIDRRRLEGNFAVLLHRAAFASRTCALGHSDTLVLFQHRACVPVRVRDSVACLLEVELPVRIPELASAKIVASVSLYVL